MINVALLKKVKKHILAEPKSLEMSMWASPMPSYMVSCGAVACVAGWAVLLHVKPKRVNKYVYRMNMIHDGDDRTWWGERAKKLLHFSNQQASSLFRFPKIKLSGTRARQDRAILKATIKKIDSLIAQ